MRQLLGADEMAVGLAATLGPENVLSGPGVWRAYDCDAYTIDKSAPAVVVTPHSTHDVARVVKWCVENQVPFTPRGAGTGLSGGALPALGGVLISTKKLTKILEIDVPNRRMKAQAGAVNKRLSDAVAEFGLHFAPDPSSQYVSTLGGNIAENSGGPHTLKYGVTAQHILGLTLVDPSGQVLEFGGGAPGAPGFDFVGQIVGAEGTMGIVTEAWIKLTPTPNAIKTALIAFSDVRQATESVAAIIGSGVIPAALEFMDFGILKALEAAFDMKPVAGTQALLLVEVDSAEPLPAAAEAVVREMAAIRAIVEAKGALDVRIAADEIERQKLWTARKKGIGAMGRLAPTIVTHDGVIPRSKLPEMLEFVYRVANESGIGVANLFHAGDGNLHPCFYFDDRDPKQVESAIHAGEQIMERCLELGGSITGEHGIGVEKLDLMEKMFSPEDLRLQEDVKRIFNEGSLCNPCKVIPNQKSCVEHRKRWRGAAW